MARDELLALTPEDELGELGRRRSTVAHEARGAVGGARAGLLPDLPDQRAEERELAEGLRDARALGDVDLPAHAPADARPGFIFVAGGVPAPLREEEGLNDPLKQLRQVLGEDGGATPLTPRPPLPSGHELAFGAVDTSARIVGGGASSILREIAGSVSRIEPGDIDAREVPPRAVERANA